MAKKNIFSFLNIFKDDDDDESINLEKSLIRHKIRSQKKQLTEDLKKEAANEVFKKIEQLPDFIKAKTILMYWSTSSELPTHEFIDKWSEEKQILLPVVVGHMMIIKPYTGRENMTKGKLGIWEPESQKSYVNQIDLVIVPGSAFDKKKRRLGRGRGYYDVYFKDKKVKKWGIAYDFQLLDNVPVTEHDVKMNKVITPTFMIE